MELDFITPDERNEAEIPEKITEILGQLAGFCSVVWDKEGVFQTEEVIIAVKNAGLWINDYYNGAYQYKGVLND